MLIEIHKSYKNWGEGGRLKMILFAPYMCEFVQRRVGGRGWVERTLCASNGGRANDGILLFIQISNFFSHLSIIIFYIFNIFTFLKYFSVLRGVGLFSIDWAISISIIN